MKPECTQEQLKEMYACYLIRGITMGTNSVLEKEFGWYCNAVSASYEDIVKFEIENAAKRLCR